MASKTVLMTAFYEQLNGLIKELSEMYPEDPDFPLYLTGISLMKSSNPSLIIKSVHEHTSQFEDKIREHNDSFFLDYSFSEFEGQVNSNIFVKLKEYVSGMSSQSKENVWKYVENITRLAKACC
jgi:hypothetical protein